MIYYPEKIKERYIKNQAAYKRFLVSAQIKKLLPVMTRLSDEVYRKNDCLACAACCKNYSPRFKGPDIKRISKYLGVKETTLIDQYLHRDEEGDYVLNSKPCVFLEKDNRCMIYSVRPSDCQRFPYTEEDVFLKKTALTLKNASFCPIAQDMIDELIRRV
jgi:Fe-S-cluster containining protein